MASTNCGLCGEELPTDARFCPACGALVATSLGTEERKVVTVLFADLVDSTGLAQRLDPERAREVLGRFFDAATQELQALRGRPEKFIGDAVMAVFGLPAVSEDDALRAVRAGLAIRARLHRLGESMGLAEPLEVRVGIESGEAAAGVGPAGQLLVTGSVVNAAARLQAAAEPGEVLAGRTTHELTRDALSFGPRREVVAKGFDTLLAGFPVAGLTVRSARRTIPFVGRSSELAILRESLVRATGTGQPVLVTILGEPGIGKSRLADELVAALGPEVIVMLGRARSYADTATFAPAATIVAELAGISEEDPASSVRERLRDLVERSGATSDGDRLLERLSLLFGIAERHQESAFVHEVHAGLLSLIGGLARDRSVVVVIEDAHTLKAAMLDLVERLGAPARGARKRVMVVALARADLVAARPAWASNTANAVTLRLDPLPPEASIELVRQAGGGRIDDEEAARIAERAGGNPFFIIETTGMLLPHDGDPVTTPRTSLPPTVQATVAARLDALPPRLRELARRASAFFVSFDLGELRVIDPDATADELRRLEEAEILVREEGQRSPGRWRLRHSMLKDVAYASVPKRERVGLHQRIAGPLAEAGHPSWAAEHLELAALASLDLDPQDRSVAGRAADALVEAGDRARRRMESRSAIDYYERALALSGPEERWGVRQARALAGMGEARYWLGEYPAATEALDRAVTLGAQLDDAFTLALALRFLGDIAINVDADLERAETRLDRSLASAEELGEPEAIVRTLLFAGWVPWTRGDTAGAEAIWRRALAVADPEDAWARVRALNSLSVNLTSGPGTETQTRRRAEEALRLSDEASALAGSAGDPFSIATTATQRARALEDLDRRDESISCLDAAIATFDDLGARWEFADATAERGIILTDLGRLEEAERDLRTATRISEELGELQLASWTWRALSRVSELRGDRPEAERQARRSREAQERFRRSRD